MTAGSFIHRLHQLYEGPVEAPLISRIESQPTGELPGFVPGRFLRMGLDRECMAVGLELVEVVADFAIDFQRVSRLSFCTTGSLGSLCYHVGEVIQVYVHAGYVSESLPLNR